MHHHPFPFRVRRYDSIQLLRLVAANMVVVYHLVALTSRVDPSYGRAAERLANVGLAGVHCFFVISGFVIASAARRERPGQFVWRRVSRIYPIYWVYLVLYALFYVWKGWPAAHPTLLQSLLLIASDWPPLVPVAWSLVHEVYFYAVFAAALASRLPFRALLIGWAALVALAQLFAIHDALLRLVTHIYTLEFVAGAALALVGRKPMARGALIAGCALVPFGQFACYAVAPDSTGLLHMVLTGLPFVFVVYGAVGVKEQSSWRCPQWVVALGDASYSTYLSHFLLLAAITRLIQLSDAAWPLHVLFAVGCIAFANAWGWLSFRLIERPLASLVGFRIGAAARSAPPR